MKQSTTHKLISPQAALALLEHLYATGSLGVKRLIADKIRDGKIRAIAKQSWLSKETKLKDARSHVPAGATGPARIRPAKLTGVDGWTEEATRWNWRGSVFHSVVTSKPISRRIFKGVRLFKQDIETLLTEAKEARRKDVSNAGRPRKEEARDELWLAIIEVATAGEFTKARLGQQQQMVTKIHEVFGRNNAPLSDSLIKATVSKIYKRFFPEI